VQQYLANCLTEAPAYVSAFLALGTEATVGRLYGFFYEGLIRIGLTSSQLRFFSIHMACDDAHAETLVELMRSYAGEPGWRLAVREGMRRALDLRLVFFDSLYQALGHRRLAGVLEGIQSKRSLAPAEIAPEDILLPRDGRGRLVYANTIDRLNVDFTVERVPFSAQVLDPRLVRIAPGSCNERHKHAHESLFFVIAGSGRVRVGESDVAVEAGDMAFVPRWALHQTENLGDEEMVLLAVTDYGLTAKAFIGDYDRTARMKRIAVEPVALAEPVALSDCPGAGTAASCDVLPPRQHGSP
jgi:quercetin dioxygenase-like cupin family protein